MKTLYELLLDVQDKYPNREERRDAYAACFAQNELYSYLQKKYGGSFPLAQALENEYRTMYEPYLCKLNPLRMYQYKKDFAPKLEDLRTIMSLDGQEALRPFHHASLYAAALVGPFCIAGGFLLGGIPLDQNMYLSTALFSGAFSWMTHNYFRNICYKVFTAWQSQALVIDVIFRFSHTKREQKS